ncbi:hypothetical protein O181_062659 [Austropuccinia psidii MF-1]|uniref:Reverse transcriptase Ty1/copia-type domain-containing protein n=1 Tax=Austropuccinia psidii MF-1 TaxID=1389203 RepID=A0A9Q3EKJ5_9BASI|nr:hypothetical protein [Austropuccinia psidii MF-1]
MLIGIKDRHKYFCLFEPKSKNIYITHNCIFLDSEAFWPKFVSNCSSSSNITKFPSNNPATEGSSKPPSSLVAPNKFGTKITHHPPCPDDSLFSEVSPIIHPLGEEQSCPEDNNSLPPQTPSPPPNVPKGWTFELVPDEAPNNIESTISSKNIILGKRHAQPPSCFVGAEFSRLERHGVLDDVTRTNDLQLLSTTWVFREKTNAHGNLLEEKAGLCVWGFLQVEGLDFHVTFAPTCCLATLCFLLGYCAEKDLDLHQMDVKTTFLHGDLNEVIHISLPEGYQPSGSANPCFVFIHVDNLVISGANLDSFQAEINSTFNMKELGELRFVLGMKVTRNRNLHLIFLTQELYVNKLLHPFKMSDCQPTSTPQVPSSSLEPVSSDLDSGEVSINFQKAVGLLNYLVTCMHSDLAFSAYRLSQFLNNPGCEHELAFMHFLCYLHGTSTWGITLGRVGDNSVISAFCNLDWGSNYDSRSFSGICLLLHGPIGWKTSKQEVVSLSSTEAKYWSISSCFQDLCWLLELVLDFGLRINANLFCDNQGALALLRNPPYQHRNRHIKLCLHWCRQILEEGTIRVFYIPSKDMIADLLTKPLPKTTHTSHCKTIGLSASSMGGC